MCNGENREGQITSSHVLRREDRGETIREALRDSSRGSGRHRETHVTEREAARMEKKMEELTQGKCTLIQCARAS